MAGSKPAARRCAKATHPRLAASSLRGARFSRHCLDDPTIASKRWVYRSTTSSARPTRVAVPGGADAAVLRARPQGRGRALQASQPGVAATVIAQPLVRSIPARCDRGGGRGGPQPSCVAPSRWLSPTTSIPFTETPQPANLAAGGWPVGGSPSLPRPWPRRSRGANVSLYNETRRPDGGPPADPAHAVWHVGLVHDLTRVTGPGWKAAGRPSGCWAAAGNRPDNQAKQASEDRPRLAAQLLSSGSMDGSTGRPPRTIWP